MSSSLVFRHHHTRHELPWGGTFAVARELGFRDAPTTELQEIVAAVEAGQPWREVVSARFAATKPWLHRIITDPVRTAFAGPVLPPGDGPVLDIGAGWGQISRPLAHHRPVVALEPVAERLAFIRAAARQEGIADRLTTLAIDYLDLEFETRFAALCVIGVFEWVGAFQEHTDPQERQRAFLRKTRTDLALGGCLVLGIENRLGLKYLLGSPDDHIGVPHVANLPAPLARERWRATTGHTLRSFTYSQAELTAWLRDAGYTEIEFFGAFPDYKLPHAILPLADGGRAVNAWLAHTSPPEEHNGYDGSPHTPDFAAALHAHYRSLAQEGAAHPFVPSFFVRAR